MSSVANEWPYCIWSCHFLLGKARPPSRAAILAPRSRSMRKEPSHASVSIASLYRGLQRPFEDPYHVLTSPSVVVPTLEFWILSDGSWGSLPGSGCNLNGKILEQAADSQFLSSLMKLMKHIYIYMYVYIYIYIIFIYIYMYTYIIL